MLSEGLQPLCIACLTLGRAPEGGRWWLVLGAFPTGPRGLLSRGIPHPQANGRNATDTVTDLGIVLVTTLKV